MAACYPVEFALPRQEQGKFAGPFVAVDHQTAVQVQVQPQPQLLCHWVDFVVYCGGR
jgi:hypothetical protein